MIYPPDDLLNDLQAVVAPDPRQSTGSDGYSHLPELPGTTGGWGGGGDKVKEPFDVPAGYDAPALSDEEDHVRGLNINQY